MWISFNDSFLSIVEPDRNSRGKSPQLLVRARRPGDIEAVFPGVTVEKRPERDYLFRALIDREVVAAMVADRVMSVDYGNFKDSVRNGKLHDAYAAVWGIMARLQPTRPYSGAAAARGRLF